MDLFSTTVFEGKPIQISVDGCSVNLKFYKDVTKNRNEKGFSRLVNTGTSGIHTTHGTFKNVAEKIKWRFPVKLTPFPNNEGGL